MDEARRCTRCILPESYPRIDFDGEGVCRVCREFDAKYAGVDRSAREASLERLLDRYRGRGRGKYDCLVPVSGGKDSTYTLWLMKNRYGMKPLAFNFDNGFSTPEAQFSVKRSVSKLGVDLYTYSPSTELLNRVYRRALELTGEFCSACVVLIPTAIFRAADIHGIRLVVAAFNEMLEAPPSETSYMDRVCFWNVMKGGFTRKELQWDFFFPSWKRMFRVKQINLPDYLDWDLGRILETLDRELDYRGTAASVRSDCRGTVFSDYLFRLRNGFGKFEFLYANMVRAGAIDREEALRIVRERGSEHPPEGFAELLASFGCDAGVLDGIGSKSLSGFRTRPRWLRSLAISLRERLP